MNRFNDRIEFARLLRFRPSAHAIIRPSDLYPDIHGLVNFYQTTSGVLTVAEVFGLPKDKPMVGGRFFAFHIHEGATCDGTNAEGPFANARAHYNPDGLPHPYHRGDLPPLISAGGIAVGASLSDRFTVDEIIGRTVIIHALPDDFTTQPGGGAGTRIACGEIVAR